MMTYILKLPPENILFGIRAIQRGELCAVILESILLLFTLLDCLQEYRQYTPRAQNLGGKERFPQQQQTQRGLRSIPVKRQPKARSAQWEVPIVLEN